MSILISVGRRAGAHFAGRPRDQNGLGMALDVPSSSYPEGRVRQVTETCLKGTTTSIASQ
ncbi:MAG: hypothetical protein VYA99_10220 [Pseudomonadota bacterium]|nr:hypothetical protein [Pseudomonadota bacterium]